MGMQMLDAPEAVVVTSIDTENPPTDNWMNAGRHGGRDELRVRERGGNRGGEATGRLGKIGFWDWVIRIPYHQWLLTTLWVEDVTASSGSRWA